MKNKCTNTGPPMDKQKWSQLGTSASPINDALRITIDVRKPDRLLLGEPEKCPQGHKFLLSIGSVASIQMLMKPRQLNDYTPATYTMLGCSIKKAKRKGMLFFQKWWSPQHITYRVQDRRRNPRKNSGGNQVHPRSKSTKY